MSDFLFITVLKSINEVDVKQKRLPVIGKPLANIVLEQILINGIQHDG